MADVADGAAGRGEALELSLMGTAERQADGDFVIGGDGVVDARLHE